MKEIKSRDIVQNRWGETRLVLAVTEDGYYVIDYGDESSSYPKYFYNPTNSCVSWNSIQKYSKVGEMPYEVFEKFISDLNIVQRKHNEAFNLLQNTINTNKEYDINKFIEKEV